MIDGKELTQVDDPKIHNDRWQGANPSGRSDTDT